MEEIIFYRDSEDLPGELDNISGNIYLPLCNALKESRIIKIRYEKYPDEYEWRNVLPEVIFHYLGEWYVAAHCYLRKEARTFRFDRIIEAVATRKKGRSHGIAEEYRKNGIPWKSTTGKRLPVYDWKNVDWEEPPPYHRETDEEKRIRNANIDLLNHAGIGRIDRLKKDLAAGADINWFDGQNTPLTRAAESGSLQTVKFLLNHGADITKRDGGKATMLFCAAWNGHDKLVRLLVEKYQCSPNDKNCHGWTALTAAARGAYHKILRCLLKHGADVNSVDRQRMNTIMFLLKDHISDSKKCLKTIRLLVENGIDIHYRDKAGRNALFYAIEKEEVEILRFLLKTGIDVNTRDNTGKTPLLAAMEAYRMIRLGQQASTMATCKKREKIVSLLCNAGADVNAADQDDEGHADGDDTGVTRLAEHDDVISRNPERFTGCGTKDQQQQQGDPRGVRCNNFFHFSTPAALRIICCSVNSSPETIPAQLPLRMTMILRHNPSSSSRSDEIRRQAAPFSARE